MAATSTEWIRSLRGPKQWKPDEAQRVLGAWKASGESMAGFAHRHGLNAQRLAWWRERLAERAEPLTLIPVTVRASSCAPRGEAVAPALSIVAGSVRVDVDDASRIPPDWLAAVIDALASRRT